MAVSDRYSVGVHVDRIAGGRVDNRNSCWPADAGGAERSGSSTTHFLLEQPSPMWVGNAELFRGAKVPATEL